jgi:aryl-alcohol dehydrogenase-like predicted oxidoreductase
VLSAKDAWIGILPLPSASYDSSLRPTPTARHSTARGDFSGLENRTFQRLAPSGEFDSSDFRNVVPRFEPEARKANRAFVDVLAEVAERKDATPAQIALAWLLAQKAWIVPIPGTAKLERLDENIGAAGLDLTPDDLRQIDDAASRITAQGARYPERLEQMTGR